MKVTIRLWQLILILIGIPLVSVSYAMIRIWSGGFRAAGAPPEFPEAWPMAGIGACLIIIASISAYNDR